MEIFRSSYCSSQFFILLSSSNWFALSNTCSSQGVLNGCLINIISLPLSLSQTHNSTTVFVNHSVSLADMSSFWKSCWWPPLLSIDPVAWMNVGNVCFNKTLWCQIRNACWRFPIKVTSGDVPTSCRKYSHHKKQGWKLSWGLVKDTQLCRHKQGWRWPHFPSNKSSFYHRKHGWKMSNASGYVGWNLSRSILKDI